MLVACLPLGSLPVPACCCLFLLIVVILSRPLHLLGLSLSSLSFSSRPSLHDRPSTTTPRPPWILTSPSTTTTSPKTLSPTPMPCTLHQRMTRTTSCIPRCLPIRVSCSTPALLLVGSFRLLPNTPPQPRSDLPISVLAIVTLRPNVRGRPPASDAVSYNDYARPAQLHPCPTRCIQHFSASWRNACVRIAPSAVPSNV